MKKRVLIITALTLLFCCALATNALAETKTIVLQLGSPNMTVNGAMQEIDPGRGTQPLIVNGSTLVPIRTIVENMGGTLAWDAGARQVTVTANNKVIRLTLDNKTADLRSQSDFIWSSKTLTVAPRSVNQRTMVPLRFVTEELGATVDWNATYKTITINFIIAAVDPLNWTGSWETSTGTIVLNQSGTIVTGTDPGYWGKITGTVTGKTLIGTWFISVSNQGDIIFTMSDDGKSFTSKWRYNYPGNTPDPADEDGGYSEGSVGQR
jgi:hypothetical protein